MVLSAKSDNIKIQNKPKKHISIVVIPSSAKGKKLMKDIELQKRKIEMKNTISNIKKANQDTIDLNKINSNSQSRCVKKSQPPRSKLFSKYSKVVYLTQNFNDEPIIKNEKINSDDEFSININKKISIVIRLFKGWEKICLKNGDKIVFVGRFFFNKKENQFEGFIGIDETLNTINLTNNITPIYYSTPNKNKEKLNNEINLVILNPSKYIILTTD